MLFEDLKKLLKRGPGSLPAPELQGEWREVFERMIVHSRSIPPKDLLTKTFPNEDEEIRQYRADNYEPITAGPFDNGFDNLYRSLAECNWSLNAPDDLKAYLDSLVINKISFWQYLFKIVLRRKIEDPNGLLVVLPFGEGITNKSKAVDVTIELVLSSRIIYWTEECIIFKSCQKSEVIISENAGVDKRPAMEGNVYYAITKTQYFLYRQIGEKNKNDYELIEYYNHNIGEFPLVVLGGRPTGKVDCETGEEEIYFNSDFHSFVAYANEAIRDKSMHQGVKATSGFPTRIMQEIPCDSKPKCTNGWHYKEGGQPSMCQRCNGLGMIVPVSQFKTIFTQKSKNNPLKTEANIKPLEFVYPSVDILKLMGEESDNALTKAEKALQSKFIEMAQSGVAKEMDRQDQYSMLYSFSDYWFDIIVKLTVFHIYKLIKPTGKDDIKIIKPISFSIKDEATLLAEFTDAMEKNVPQGSLIDLYLDWIKKRFSGDKVRMKIELTAIFYDPFYVYTVEKKNEFLMANVMKQNDYIKSIRISGVLLSMYQDLQDKFLQMEFAQLVAEIDKRMLPFLESTTPPAPPI